MFLSFKFSVIPIKYFKFFNINKSTLDSNITFPVLFVTLLNYINEGMAYLGSLILPNSIFLIRYSKFIKNPTSI